MGLGFCASNFVSLVGNCARYDVIFLQLESKIEKGAYFFSGLDIAQLLFLPSFTRIFCALLKFQIMLSIQYSSKTFIHDKITVL